MSCDTIKNGLVVHKTRPDKVGLIGANGGSPFLFPVPSDSPFKVGDWCEVNIATNEIRKRPEPLTEVNVDNLGLITIKSFLIRFDNVQVGTALSPHVGPVIVPTHFNFRKGYVYEANITCYVNSPEYVSLMENFKTSWKLSEHAKITQVEGITKLTNVESLALKAGWKNEIELKPKTLDKEDILRSVTTGVEMKRGNSSGVTGNNQDASQRNDKNGSKDSNIRNNNAAVPSNNGVAEPVVDKEYPYVGVVVSVETEMIVVYTREGGNVYVDKKNLTVTQRFELTSCNWVKLNVGGISERPGYRHRITNIRASNKSEMDKEWRDIEWAAVKSLAKDGNDSIKLSNATLYFAPKSKSLGSGMSVSLRRPGENVVYHPFVGEVIVEQRAHYSIREHRESFDATVELTRDSARTMWRVTQFVYDGQELTLNGYMSKIGHGKWQQVRDHNLPRLAQQKEKNLTTKNSCPAPNAAVKGSLGWHIPTLPEPGQEGEAEGGEEKRGAGDVGAENPLYEDVLAITTSLLAPKVEFARKLEAPDDDADTKKKGIMTYGFTQNTSEMDKATYSMPPAVTTMPMKIKNEMMGTEGGWNDRGWKSSHSTKDKRLIMEEEEERRQRDKKKGDEEWFVDEYDIDDKGKKRQEGWERVETIGMVVKVQKGSYIVWMKEMNRVIAVRSKDLYVTAWTHVNYLWNEERKMINLSGITCCEEDQEGIAAQYDDTTHKITVRCVVDFIKSESESYLISSVLGMVEVHEPNVHDQIWDEDLFMKRLEIDAEFRLEDGEEGLSSQWVMTELVRVIGDIEEKQKEKE
ncbi:hypothetical protein PENTCL1PPCAC_11468 [Pristionchus entomophagus]|uniref:Uncharacterized protein n=1 Tax=Pristionchus entomophagus TaxID=358040 RepID=A0AAV5T8Z0_9BILA|nr:hypothetical protein PENTCL1PPCAC_11468 [Pristionchus entomophagus]